MKHNAIEKCDEANLFLLFRNEFGRNVYFNFQPYGVMIGQHSFGEEKGLRNDDKSGCLLNQLSWVSPRTIKETLLPADDFRYPYMS
jgi:1-pyrroline-5-carboxylate dehydrogenase